MADGFSIRMELRHSRSKRICHRSRKGGYRLIRFFGSVRQDLVCRACSGVVRDPVECLSCGTLICRGCWMRQASLISQLAGGVSECPSCRRITAVRTASRLLKQIILNLTVYCKYKHLGCDTMTSLVEVKAHEKKCQFQELPCGNVSNCQVRDKLKNMIPVEEFYGKQGYVCSTICQRTLDLKRLLEERKIEKVLELFSAAARR